MPIIKCNLVGFPYNEWKGTDLKQRLMESVGERVVLVNEPENPRTPEAMAAMINFEMAAYVQETKCHDFFWYCSHSQCDVLEGSVTGYDLDECSLTVDVNVEELLDVPARKVDEEVMAWDEAHLNFPVIGLMRDELKARALRKDILLLLKERRKMDAVMENDLRAMERVMGIDVSREANEERRQIVELLKSSDDERARTWGHRLGCRLTEMGGSEATLRRLRYILDEVTRTDQFRKLKGAVAFLQEEPAGGSAGGYAPWAVQAVSNQCGGLCFRDLLSQSACTCAQTFCEHSPALGRIPQGDCSGSSKRQRCRDDGLCGTGAAAGHSAMDGTL